MRAPISTLWFLLFLLGACARPAPNARGVETATREQTSQPSDGFVQIEPGVRFREDLAQRDAARRIWIYVPDTAAPVAGWPLVVVPPAGSDLLTGIRLSNAHRPEHLPYVHAGYAVLSFDISGSAPEGAADTMMWLKAVSAFLAARGGVQDGIAALNHALRTIRVDRTRVFFAGHSSAATLVLQMAAEDPRLRAVAAFAPVTDIEWWIHEVLGLPRVSLWEKVVEEQSVTARASQLRAPVFLFHATADGTVPVAQSRAFAARLEQLGVPTRYREEEGGDHYESTLWRGIPAAIAWFASLEAEAYVMAPMTLLSEGEAEERAGDLTRAYERYRHACDEQDWEGCIRAGRMQYSGKGTAYNAAEAQATLERACKHELRACNEWGRALRSGGSEEAHRVFEEACARGAQDACVNLGRSFEHGWGPWKDPAQARVLYQRACDAHDAEGCYMLAHTFDDPDFKPIDRAEKQRIMKHACREGMALACREARREEERTGPPFGEDGVDVVYFHTKAILACVSKHQGAPGAKTLDLRLTFVSDGRLTAVELENDPNNTLLHRCVWKVLKKVRVAPFRAPRYELYISIDLERPLASVPD